MFGGGVFARARASVHCGSELGTEHLTGLSLSSAVFPAG